MTDKTGRMVAALAIFLTCIIARTVLQLIGGPEIGDVSWVTTFGAIGASWLGLSGQLSQVEKQTNGLLTAKIEEHADAAASKAIEKAILSQDSPLPHTLNKSE
jgi:hypothetical protein